MDQDFRISHPTLLVFFINAADWPPWVLYHRDWSFAAVHDSDALSLGDQSNFVLPPAWGFRLAPTFSFSLPIAAFPFGPLLTAFSFKNPACRTCASSQRRMIPHRFPAIKRVTRLKSISVRVLQFLFQQPTAQMVQHFFSNIWTISSKTSQAKPLLSHRSRFRHPNLLFQSRYLVDRCPWRIRFTMDLIAVRVTCP